MRLAGRTIVLGVTGSIAAYKSVFLLRLLQQEGAEVEVVMTPAAREFVAPLMFATLSRKSVFTDLWADEVGAGNQPDWSRHVQLGHRADLILVAPATANSLAKLAHGLCDDALQAVLLSANCPVLMAPAMDREMYQHPATQHNLALLKARGTHLVEAASGYLASGLEGQGRMAEPEALLEAVVSILAPAPQLLAGRKVLLTAGPTQEALDPVRYISNHSTGKMGIAIAEAAHQMGAEVTLVLGPTALRPTAAGIKVVPVVSAIEMQQAVEAHADAADIFILSAAVADYRPAHTAEEKLKKTDANTEGLTLTLVRNPDILAGLGQTRRPNQLLVGFALETNNAEAYGREKLQRKKCDIIVLNTLADPGAGFGYDTNKVTLLHRDGRTTPLPLMSKADIGRSLMQTFAEELARLPL